MKNNKGTIFFISIESSNVEIYQNLENDKLKCSIFMPSIGNLKQEFS